MNPTDIDKELREAFYRQLRDFASLHNLPVDYPQIEYRPGNEQHYLSVSILPTPPDSYAVDGSAQLNWIAQVNVRSREGQGEIAALSIAALIAARWPSFSSFAGTLQHLFLVTDHATIAPTLPVSNGWFTRPVSIPIRHLYQPLAQPDGP